MTTLLPPTSKGAYRLPTPPPSPTSLSNQLPCPGNRWKSASPSVYHSGKIPKLDFPVFDGENQNCGLVVVRTILSFLSFILLCGSSLPLCISMGQQLAGYRPWINKLNPVLGKSSLV